MLVPAGIPHSVDARCKWSKRPVSHDVRRTRQYDDEAMRYLSYVLYPLVRRQLDPFRF